MKLYLLRHGLATDRSAANAASDHLRPLTAEGKRKMRKVARGMKAMELAFDLILSSPFQRARQTAEIVAEIFKAEERFELAAELAAGGNPKALLAKLARRQAESVLLVGHEPDLSNLISLLVAGRSGLGVALKKGGLCKLSIASFKPGARATLEWLLTPKQMVRMT